MTPALSRRCSNQLSYRPFGGPAERGGTGTRTPDIQLAKLALYQLSYTPLSRKAAPSRSGGRSLRTHGRQSRAGFPAWTENERSVCALRPRAGWRRVARTVVQISL